MLRSGVFWFGLVVGFIDVVGMFDLILLIVAIAVCARILYCCLKWWFRLIVLWCVILCVCYVFCFAVYVDWQICFLV